MTPDSTNATARRPSSRCARRRRDRPRPGVRGGPTGFGAPDRVCAVLAALALNVGPSRSIGLMAGMASRRERWCTEWLTAIYGVVTLVYLCGDVAE